MEKNNCAIILLAAGVSSRLGRPKQLLLWKGKTLLERSIDTCLDSQMGPVLCVLGARYASLQKLVEKKGIDYIKNADWETGMGSSIRTGINTALQLYTNLDRVLICLVDQPLINSDHLKAMYQAHRNTPQTLSAAFYNNGLGVPALFESNWFESLSRLNEAQGAKKIIRQNASQVYPFPCPSAAFDIDTEEDYQKLLDL